MGAAVGRRDAWGGATSGDPGQWVTLDSRLLGVLLFSLAVHPLWRHVVIYFEGLSVSSEVTPSHQLQDPLPVMMQAPFSPSLLLRCVT